MKRSTLRTRHASLTVMLAPIVLALLYLDGCGNSKTPGDGGASDRVDVGTTGSGGRGVGTGGATGGGSGGRAGGAGGGASGGSAGGAGTGTQPVGSFCANTNNCSQADGQAVCCLNIATCVLAPQCPGGTNYLPCKTKDDCATFGGGKICCEASAGGQVMRYCTKPSGCQGTPL